MEHDMPGNSAAFEQTVRSTIELAATFSAADWDRPTDLPGWSVKDVVSHLVAVESILLGVPGADPALADGVPHVRNDLGRMMEPGVAVRRATPGPKVLEELRDVLDRRLAALPAIDPAEETWNPDGRTGPYSRLMLFRAFDCWTHEQDLRRAVGRPGNLDGPGGDRAWHVLGGALPYVVAKRAGARPGQSAAFEITGARERALHIQVGDDGRARRTDELPGPTTTLRMDWETFVRLAAGRAGAEDAEVEIAGDKELAARILDNLAVTP